MNAPLIGLHAGLGEFAALMFAWAFIALLSAGEANVRRARVAVLLGTLFLVAAWLGGGYYYVSIYGSEVKPFIKEGPMPWAHGVAMETKEHVFLFLPFLGAFAWGLMQRLGSTIGSDARARAAALWTTGSVVVACGFMAFMGFLVTTGFRSALEGLVR